MGRTKAESAFDKELAEFDAELKGAEKDAELDEAKRKAARRSPAQWDLLTMAARAPGGVIQVRLPRSVPVARALTTLELGEYFPPPKIGSAATFSISAKGRALLDVDV